MQDPVKHQAGIESRGKPFSKQGSVKIEHSDTILYRPVILRFSVRYRGYTGNNGLHHFRPLRPAGNGLSLRLSLGLVMRHYRHRALKA